MVAFVRICSQYPVHISHLRESPAKPDNMISEWKCKKKQNERFYNLCFRTKGMVKKIYTEYEHNQASPAKVS